MRADRIPVLLAAAMAIVAIPAPAFACEKGAHQGGGSGAAPSHAQAAKPNKPATPASKPAAGAPATPAAPAAPAQPSECCTPQGAAVAPKAEAPKMAECCAKTMAGNPQPCCIEHMKGNKQACCEASGMDAKGMGHMGMGDKGMGMGHKGMGMGDKKDPCCDTPGKGECCAPDKPHGMGMDGKPGMMHEERRMEMRGHHMGGWGRHFGGAPRAKGHEVRYMPVMAPGTNQYAILGFGRRLQLNDWLSLGGQTNYALQLGNAPGNGPWFVPYCGFLPRVGAGLGPVRADLGALLGVGGMLRTGTVGTTDHVLQARLMWVVEPRVELGWQGERMGVGLVGAYALNPNQTEFGGPSAGLRFTWKGGHGGMRGHEGMRGGER